MKAIVLAIALVLGSPVAAQARDYRDDRDCESGNCGNRSSDQYGQCKYMCPTFDKSPVQDSFNPVVCLPGATCNFGDKKEQPPKDQKPQSVGCLVPFPYHCDPHPK